MLVCVAEEGQGEGFKPGQFKEMLLRMLLPFYEDVTQHSWQGSKGSCFGHPGWENPFVMPHWGQHAPLLILFSATSLQDSLGFCRLS